MKKLTKTNFKSFLKKNANKLYVRNKMAFDGMVDGVVDCDNGFKKAISTNEFPDHKYGFKGIWLVGGGRDYFREFNEDGFTGIRVDNCCGAFIVAIAA